ncbi:GIY-YIG nuclease family protein [Flavobacterium sp. 14A]|uniref:GIY-YIG nuclease family protein n=1 Tax=Flavobacterium sp. 14A TaxID=2735896 RepID=UPI00156DAACB|nr:GIY-YIG nuclease family protein [Flavobacterium sp. 14A]NRT13374.1 hypothetical protein [Flavobacterium sp. 14A]
MALGKTIKIFLIDGDSNGRMSCELSNWTGKAYKIPRINIKECSDRDDLNNTGIYLLFGKDDEDNDLVYIGEAESVFSRLKQHLSGKEFWNEAIIFISKDDNLNKAHIKYLENRLHDIAVTSKRYKVENSIIPTQSSISESDRAEMEEFIGYVKILVNTLGHKVFDEKRIVRVQVKQDVFYIKAARGAEGQGEPTPDGFLIFKGSKAAHLITASLSPSLVKNRQKLIENGLLVDKGDYYEFVEDYIFSSPSYAAATLMGRSANGQTEWKLTDGRSLKDFETTI